MTLIFKEDTLAYFDDLEETRKNEDIKIYRNFRLNQSDEYFQSEIANMTKEQKQDKPKGGGLSFLF